MGFFQSKDAKLESMDEREVKRVMDEKGIAGVQALMRKRIDGWEDVEIKIGVTGDAGVGKSNFINTIRGLEDGQEGAAPTGVVETTTEPTLYSFPDNPKIVLVDLPGIGTTTFPLDTYCEKVKLNTYDTFLILTGSRFTECDLQVAQKIKSMGKSFFLVRTKIDLAHDSEKRSNRNTDEMLTKIESYCYESVKSLGIRKEEIFLISNWHRNRWHFERLVQEILNKLPTHQKEALTLSLKISSKEFVERKVKILREKFKIFYLLSVVKSQLQALPVQIISHSLSVIANIFSESQPAVPSFGNKFQTCLVGGDDSEILEMPDDSDMDLFSAASIAVALAVFGRKAKSYRSQVGLPEEDSKEFQMMKPEFQKRMRKFYLKDDEYMRKRSFKRFLRMHSSLQSSSKSPYDVVQECFNKLLDEMQKLSFDILDDTAIQIKETME